MLGEKLMTNNLKVNNSLNQQLTSIIELTKDCKEAASVIRWLNSKSKSQPLPSYFPTTHDIEESFEKNVLSVIRGENRQVETNKSLVKQK